MLCRNVRISLLQHTGALFAKTSLSVFAAKSLMHEKAPRKRTRTKSY